MKNIYLIKSSSFHLTDMLIKDISGNNDNITIVSLMDTSIYNCIEDASYFGLFDGPRVIVIKDTKYFGGKFNYEEESEAIKKFLNNMDETLTIVFVCDSIVTTKDLTKTAVSLGAKIIDKSTLGEEDISNIISDYTKEKGIKIDAKATNLILKNADNNIDIALTEIDKLSNVDAIITETIVNEYGTKIESDETFAFIDAVVHKDFKTAFDILDVLITKNTEVNGIISLLARRYAEMYIAKSVTPNDMSDDDLAKRLNYKKGGKIYFIRKDAKIYTLDQLKEIIINLSILDKKVKTGTSPVYGLKELLLSL